MTLEGSKSNSKGGKTIIPEKINVITIITHFSRVFNFSLSFFRKEIIRK